MFTGQPLFYQVIVTLSLFFTLSIGYEIADDFPLRQNNGRIIRDCEDMKREDMIRHVYVYGDSSDGIHLKCPGKPWLFEWQKLSFGSDSDYYRDFPRPFEKFSEPVLNIPLNKTSSGVYCCSKFNIDDGSLYPSVSHVVLVMPKAPEINVPTSSRTNTVKDGDEISLQCSIPYIETENYLEPKIIWEKNSVEVRGANEVEHKFKVTPEDHNANFSCGLRYENLTNNGGSRTFRSNHFVLEVSFVIMDHQLSTDNGKLIKVDIGNSTTLTCVFKSQSPLMPKYLGWTKRPLLAGTSSQEVTIDCSNNNTDNRSKCEQKTEPHVIYVKNVFSLTLNNFTEDDCATYECNWRNHLSRVFNVLDPESCPLKSARSPSIILSVNYSLDLILASLLTAALLLA